MNGGPSGVHSVSVNVQLTDSAGCHYMPAGPPWPPGHHQNVLTVIVLHCRPLSRWGVNYHKTCLGQVLPSEYWCMPGHLLLSLNKPSGQSCRGTAHHLFFFLGTRWHPPRKTKFRFFGNWTVRMFCYELAWVVISDLSDAIGCQHGQFGTPDEPSIYSTCHWYNHIWGNLITKSLR